MNSARPEDGLAALLAMLQNAAPLGTLELPNGAKLLGRAPHVAPEAWLHVIFPGLSDDEIARLANEIGRPIPLAYRRFLARTNGLFVFTDALALHGLRRSQARSGASAWQPFSMVPANTVERPKDAPGSAIFVGSYAADGSRLYLDGASGEVVRTARASAAPLNRWVDFNDFCLRETTRLSSMFDREGRLLTPGLSTAPLPQS